MMAALAIGTSARAAPPLEAYGRLPAIDNVSLSPSGELFALVGRAGQGQRLFVRKADGEVVFLADLGAMDIVHIEWAGEDHLLVVSRTTVGKKYGNVPMQVWSSVLNIDLKTRKVAAIFHGSTTVIDAVFGWYGTRKINGRWYAMVGGISYDKVFARSGKEGPYAVYPDIYRFDLDANTYDRIGKAALGAKDWVVSPDGSIVGHGVYDVQGRNQGVYFGATNDNAIGAPKAQLVVDGLGRSADSILVADRTDSAEVTREFRPGGPPEGEVLFRDTQGDTALRDPETGLLVGIQHGVSGQAEFLDPARQKRLEAGLRAFPGTRERLVSYTSDLGRMVIYTDGSKDSGTYWLVDIAKKSARPIGDARPDIKPEDLGPVSLFNYKAADGVALDGVLTLPPGAGGKPLALVIIPNRRADGPRAIVGFDLWAQALASHGYAVFQPNPRGTLGYGDAFYQMGDGEVGKKQQSDVSDAIPALAALGLVDPHRVCIEGADHGGYVALAGVTLQQGVYRCAVSIAGPVDLPAFSIWARNIVGDDQRRLKSIRAPMGPVGDTPLDKISPARVAKRADAAVLLIHGTDDTVVPVEQSQHMASALKGEGKPVELVLLPGENHFFNKEASQIRTLAAAVAFVEKHNPAN